MQPCSSTTTTPTFAKSSNGPPLREAESSVIFSRNGRTGVLVNLRSMRMTTLVDIEQLAAALHEAYLSRPQLPPSSFWDYDDIAYHLRASKKHGNAVGCAAGLPTPDPPADRWQRAWPSAVFACRGAQVGAWTSRGRGRQGGATEKGDGMIIRRSASTPATATAAALDFSGGRDGQRCSFGTTCRLHMPCQKKSNERIRRRSYRWRVWKYSVKIPANND